MASGVRRVRGRNGLRARDAAHGHTAVVAVIFIWTVFIVVVRVRVVLVVLVVLVVIAPCVIVVLRRGVVALAPALAPALGVLAVGDGDDVVGWYDINYIYRRMTPRFGDYDEVA